MYFSFHRVTKNISHHDRERESNYENNEKVLLVLGLSLAKETRVLCERRDGVIWLTTNLCYNSSHV